MDLTARESSIKDEVKDEDDLVCLFDPDVASNGTKESRNSWSVLGLLPPDEKSVFSYDQTITLLKEVKNNWNRLSDKSVKKDDVWNEISAVVGIDKKKCNQKFRNIKDRYKKYRDSVTKGFRDLKQPTFFNEIDDILRNTDLNEGSENLKEIISNDPPPQTIAVPSQIEPPPTVSHKIRDNSDRQQPIIRKRKLNSFVYTAKGKTNLSEKPTSFSGYKVGKSSKTAEWPNNRDIKRDNCDSTANIPQSGLNFRNNIPDSATITAGCSNNDSLFARTGANLSSELFLNHLKNNAADLSLLNPLALLPGLLSHQANGLFKPSNDMNNGFDNTESNLRNSSFSSSAHSDRQFTPYQVEKLNLLRRLVEAVERHNDLLEKNLIQF